MNIAEYKKYLLSPEWKAMRAAVLKRSGGKCQDCISERRIRGSGSGYMVWPAREVHHLTYERIGRESLDDLIALCEPHHKARHFPNYRADREFQRTLDVIRRVERKGGWVPDLSTPQPNLAEQLGVRAVEITEPRKFTK